MARLEWSVVVPSRVRGQGDDTGGGETLICRQIGTSLQTGYVDGLLMLIHALEWIGSDHEQVSQVAVEAPQPVSVPYDHTLCSSAWRIGFVSYSSRKYQRSKNRVLV